MLAKLDPAEAAAPGPWICWLWFDLLPEQIQALLLQLAMLEGDDQVKGSRGSREPENPDWCFFFNRFGSKAKKSKPGYQWKAEN